MNRLLKNHLEYLLCIQINTVRSLSGGDISKAYLIETDTEKFFCKVQDGTQGLAMFRAEQTGLQALGETKTIAVPKVLFCGTFQESALLIMRYIAPKKPTTSDFERLGHQLAAHYQISRSSSFGFKANNFIGSLAQSNTTHTNWTLFYVLERLLPQLQLALNAGKLQANEIPSETTLLKNCESLFPTVKPSLLHGDLWSGNFLISEQGEPYLIDPAVYYGHYEVDLAMTQLFGGFGTTFYEAYHEVLPKESGANERCDIYQLYYLLVHLNLFGSSYKSQVEKILQRYFG